MAPPLGLSSFQRKMFKNLLLRNYRANFFQISQKCSLSSPLSDSLKLLPLGPKWPRPKAFQFFQGLFSHYNETQNKNDFLIGKSLKILKFWDFVHR